MRPSNSRSFSSAAVMVALLSACATAPKGGSGELARLIENREAAYRVKTPPVGHGSGVVVSRGGYILTAAHIATKNPILEVTVRADGEPKPYVAEIVDIDFDHDLALIKIPHTFENVAVLEDPKNVAEGDSVYNIGYPYDLEKIVGRGSIMKIDFDATISNGPKKPKLGIEDALILDIPDGPGTSGSGVFSAKSGKLVGIMSMIVALEIKGYPPFVFKIAQSVKHARVLLDQNKVPYENETAATAGGSEWIVTVTPRGGPPPAETR